jgi:hypothetical protein
MKIQGFAFVAALLFALPASAGSEGPSGPDWDSDGMPDAWDNCSEVYNPQQYDGDQDGYGNQCDGDYSAAQNNYVDGGDFTAFVGVFGTFVPPTSCEYDHAVNGYVDGGDFTAFVSFFGQAPGPACRPAPGGTRGTPCASPGVPCP